MKSFMLPKIIKIATENGKCILNNLKNLKYFGNLIGVLHYKNQSK